MNPDRIDLPIRSVLGPVRPTLPKRCRFYPKKTDIADFVPGLHHFLRFGFLSIRSVEDE